MVVAVEVVFAEAQCSVGWTSEIKGREMFEWIKVIGEKAAVVLTSAERSEFAVIELGSTQVRVLARAAMLTLDHLMMTGQVFGQALTWCSLDDRRLRKRLRGGHNVGEVLAGDDSKGLGAYTSMQNFNEENALNELVISGNEERRLTLEQCFPFSGERI